MNSGVTRCEECGIVLGYIITSEWLTQALCISCARKNNDDKEYLKRIE